MDAIRSALEFLERTVNRHFAGELTHGDDWLVLTNPTGMNGQPNPATLNRVVMCLYGMERESAEPFQSTQIHAKQSSRQQSGGHQTPTPPVRLNLQLMFMANFTDDKYGIGLSHLSRIISFFQQVPVFSGQNFPDFPLDVRQFTMEFEGRSTSEVRDIMAMMGVHYLPTVFYKLRLLPFDVQAQLVEDIKGVPPSGGNIA